MDEEIETSKIDLRIENPPIVLKAQMAAHCAKNRPERNPKGDGSLSRK